MKLFKHQQQGLTIAQHHPRWAFFWDTGTGKTLLGLSIIHSKQGRTLIVAPKILLKDAWLGDAKRFYPELYKATIDFHTIKSKQRAKRLIREYPILVINYESLLHNQWVLTDYNWDILILDESQKIKNPKSKITKLMLKYAIEIPNIYLLSGTPAPNTELEYYPQLRLLMPDKICPSWYKFRQKWFYPIDRNGWKWKLSNKEAFEELLQQCSSVVKKEDVLDLQGQFYRIINYQLSSKEAQFYKKMLKDALLEFEEGNITAQQSVVKIMKLRQILSGFGYDDNGNTIKLGDSKLKALMQMLDILGNEQIIIWIQYEEEADQLNDALGNVAVITGKTKDKDRHIILQRFREGKIQYLVAHPKTIGHGITLTNVNRAIYIRCLLVMRSLNNHRIGFTDTVKHNPFITILCWKRII